MYALHVNTKPALVAAVPLRPFSTGCGHITISFLLSSFLVVGHDGLGDNGMVGNNGEGVAWQVSRKLCGPLSLLTMTVSAYCIHSTTLMIGVFGLARR
jgi:hypothetical protein